MEAQVRVVLIAMLVVPKVKIQCRLVAAATLYFATVRMSYI